MTTIPNEPTRMDAGTSRWTAWLLLRDVWASIAISVIWLTVLFDAMFGPDIVTTNSAPGQSTTVPSAVVVAFFAFLATWVIAKYAFGRPRDTRQ
jgi:hypothetical protein